MQCSIARSKGKKNKSFIQNIQQNTNTKKSAHRSLVAFGRMKVYVYILCVLRVPSCNTAFLFSFHWALGGTRNLWSLRPHQPRAEPSCEPGHLPSLTPVLQSNGCPNTHPGWQLCIYHHNKNNSSNYRKSVLLLRPNFVLNWRSTVTKAPMLYIFHPCIAQCQLVKSENFFAHSLPALEDLRRLLFQFLMFPWSLTPFAGPNKRIADSTKLFHSLEPFQ